MPIETLQAPSPEVPEEVGPREPRGPRRLVAVVMLLLIAAALATRGWDVVRGAGPAGGWVEVGSLEAVRQGGVLKVSGHDVFVVYTQDGPIALSSRSTHLGKPLIFCQSSGWFEDPMHGSKFDALGFYAAGPAPRGMDRIGLRIRDGEVEIDPDAVSPGASREAGPVLQPSGPFCSSQAA